jgi:RHS repeat-associated protein
VLEMQGNTVTDKYTRGIGLVKSSSLGYYIYNARGDVTGLTHATTGALTKRYKYDAFGNEVNADTNDSNPWRYCGEYFDKETGNYYLRARFYNPRNGRFLTEDPIRDGLNWYTYVYNNPVYWIDPWGLFGQPTISADGGGTRTLAPWRQSARDYMEAYYSSPNPEYPIWGLNCANFVSQVLSAGGLTVTYGVWYVSNNLNTGWNNPALLYNMSAVLHRLLGLDSYFNDATLNGFSVWVSSSWNNANAHYNYFSNPANGFINGSILVVNSSNITQMLRDNIIQTGDLLYWSSDGGNSMHHATIISSVSSTDIFYSGNTSSRFDHSLRGAIGSGTVYIVRLRDDAFAP